MNIETIEMPNIREKIKKKLQAARRIQATEIGLKIGVGTPE